jgi:hypothetical protein
LSPLPWLLGTPTALGFTAIICLFNGFWNFFHSYVLAAFALFGKNSRMLIYANPFLFVGLSAGPAMASALVGENNFTYVIVGSMVLLGASLLLLLAPALTDAPALVGRRN